MKQWFNIEPSLRLGCLVGFLDTNTPFSTCKSFIGMDPVGEFLGHMKLGVNAGGPPWRIAKPVYAGPILSGQGRI